MERVQLKKREKAYLFHFSVSLSSYSLNTFFSGSPQVGSEGPESCQHFSSSKKLVQKAGCFPEGCDRWQDHRAELGWFTQVEGHQGAGSTALEIIPGLLQLLILTLPHPSKL